MGGRIPAAGGRFDEGEFEYHAVECAGAQNLLCTEQGDPLVLGSQTGQGMLLLVTVIGWGKREARYEPLKGILHALGETLAGLDLIEVHGRPIHHQVNVTDRADELIVSLTNNSPDVPWEGNLRVKGQRIASVEEWMGFGETGIVDGGLLCAVPPNDLRIYRIRTEESFLPLSFEHVDWRKLGFGIPEFETEPEVPGRRKYPWEA